MQPFHPSQGPMPAQSASQGGGEALASRATMLLQRMMEVERALDVQEWWLLARAVPEAQPLSEVVSLLAVARGEVEQFLAQYFGRHHAAREPADSDQDPPTYAQDGAWISATRDQAIALLRMAAAALPAMQQYARTLSTNAARLGMPNAAVDALNIVAERLADAYETLSQPPS